ncbi:MAG: lipopolysaccharide biosynthesis protein [Ignavibacteriaceae bacterium]|nr:lipopolysaccharide biosynthesis protein [Ignavibacteriaceae bacterium]
MTEIRKNIRSGVFYTAISKYSNIAASIIISAVLARLLTPSEFGVVAIIIVFISFFNLLSSFGIGSAVVQNKSLSDEDISSIFTFSILFGFILAVIFFFISPIIASFYNQPVLANLSRLMSLTIFFNSLQIVPNAVNLKNLRFRELGIISIGVHVLSGIIAVVLAYMGFSYYALIINSIINALLLFIAYYYLAPIKPTLSIKFGSINKIIKYSTFQFLFQFINYFSGNTDSLLIGKFFNASALGFYDKAVRLMLMPVQNLTHVITPVLHPVLSEYQDDKTVIYNTYVRIVKLLALIGFPLSVFLHFNASEIINIIYGPQWNQSIPVFKLLALSVGIQIILSSGGSICQATNRTDLLFYSGLLSTIVMLLGISYGVFIGKSLVSIGFGILFAVSINVFQAFYLVIKHALNQSYTRFLKVLVFPVILSIGVASTLWLISFLTIGNIIVSLLIKFFITIFTIFLILLMSKENLSFLKENGLKLLKK